MIPNKELMADKKSKFRRKGGTRAMQNDAAEGRNRQLSPVSWLLSPDQYSRRTRTSLGFAPSAGPTTPSRSIRSMILAARL